MSLDGKYVTLALVKQWASMQQAASTNPTVYNGAVQGSPDDNILAGAIQVAESDFDLNAGVGFDQQTFTKVQPRQVFVDSNGWLWLWPVERAPVTAITSVEVRDILNGATTWQTVTYTSDDILLPPVYSFDTAPRAESWKVRIWPNPTMLSEGTTDLLARWSYTGGFASIPTSLSSLIAAMAYFIYKSQREAILGQLVTQPLGTMTFAPVVYPKTIKAEIDRWMMKL